jgi:hypothetical protein
MRRGIEIESGRVMEVYIRALCGHKLAGGPMRVTATLSVFPSLLVKIRFHNIFTPESLRLW